jgi:uncharacterized membrane protein YdjX (TVP38/TMEM64 family)
VDRVNQACLVATLKSRNVKSQADCGVGGGWMAEPTTRNLNLLKVAVLGLVITAYFFLPGLQHCVSMVFSYLRHHDFDGLRHFILSYGIWAPVISILIMALQSLFPLVPGLAVTISNAWIFGWHYGALYSWTGALLGAILDFGIARWYGRPLVERLVNMRYLSIFDCFFQRHGILAVFITRLTPVIPFKIVSYGAGLTAITVWQFMLATGVGQMPAIVLYSVLGEHLTHSIRIMIAITTLMALAGCLVFYYRATIECFLHSRKK